MIASPTAPAAVAITGIGCIGAPGTGIEAHVQALNAGRTGLVRCALDSHPLAVRFATGVVTADLPPLHSRSAALGVVAGREALAMAAIDRSQRTTLDCCIGTCTGGMPESERRFAADCGAAAHPIYKLQPTHRVTRQIAGALCCGGRRSTHAPACAAAAAALVEAMEWLRQGLSRQVLVVGCDALCRFTMGGFHSLGVLSASGTRPFTTERDGMSLGEGAAALVLERGEHAAARGVRPLAWLRGWGMAVDAHHPTACHPEGRYLRRAIDQALADAALPAAAIDYCCAHGTGTRDNDASEARALADAFGPVPVASWKRCYGHTMGACAAIEAVGCVLALQHQRAFASAGAAGHDLLDDVRVLTATSPRSLRHVCSTTLAFGGIDVCLVLSAEESA